MSVRLFFLQTQHGLSFLPQTKVRDTYSFYKYVSWKDANNLSDFVWKDGWNFSFLGIS